ncbi:metallophosphoesterase [Inhella inkyongensis]|uniref:metallophosphoesterase n=1 Tax=Inhella inkyongensis TaxID=392593 RepID=UPI00110D5862|nr:metallophosphoesterase [Inhella inkyongensis]
MRLQLFSDLHLERDPAFQPQVVPDANVLVLAGDIGSYQAGSHLLPFGPDADWGLSRFSPRLGAPWKRVLYVPGNHEYDGLPWPQAQTQLRACCERLGIEWLDRELIVIDGVRFLGCTLWADFDLLVDPRSPMAAQLKARDKAYRAANFYLRRFSALEDDKPMLAERLRELALADQDWLRAALAQPFEGRTVVVTHFAPSGLSADPRYGLTPGTAGFCSALDALLPQADLWLHGHLHCRHDYRMGRCRVVANARGYAGKGEQDGFIEALGLTV